MEKVKMFWFLFSSILACSETAKILVVFPMPSKSHGILGDGYVRHLLNAGHEVTYITPFTYKNPPAKLHIIDVGAIFDMLPPHRNLVVFITYSGLLSTTEVIHFGVPIIGIPVFGDQFMNVEKAVNIGFAQRVKPSYKMADDLKIAILEVVSNKRYANKSKELSCIHHDRPVKPGVELVHWVNHVVNTRGAPHLRSPALDLPFYKRRFLDFAALIAVLVFAAYVLLKRFCANISSKGKSGSMKKNN